MQRTFAANWKMNHGPQETRAFLQQFMDAVPASPEKTLLFFPPAVSLVVAGFAVRDRPDIMVGIQNVYWEEKGAFTGENSAAMARDAGAKVALVGHSERRVLFGETDEMTSRKCATVFKAGLIPLLCVGEKLEERDRNTTHAVVLRQVKAGISRLDASQIARIMIAYEPVWAIGTGRTARPEDATQVQSAIRRTLRDSVGAKANDIPILYGGSVSPENAASLLAAADVDGVLVGGSSLEAATWASIVRA
ncbi:MAG TPA: triose-phosphate isomerase [Gemmatimonadaceae bacterium]|nr:triose-phosphate isomerase [Gemmatimonadaceae bacterium]